MKNILKYTLLLVAALLLGSCEKEEIPMTNTVALAGEWSVTVDVLDGEDVIADPYGLGQFTILTYNTNKDDGKELYVDDLGNFWEFKVVTPCSISNLTFGSEQPSINEVTDYEIEVTVTGGKITPNGAVTPSGMPADGIEFYVTFEDEPDTVYYTHGYRRTGFVADE